MSMDMRTPRAMKKTLIHSIALILLPVKRFGCISTHLNWEINISRAEADQPLQFTEELFIFKGMGENCLPWMQNRET